MRGLRIHSSTDRLLPELGPRLQAVASLVPSGVVVGDIGTDHAYVPVWLVATGRCPRAIAVDVSRGALSAARRTVELYGLAHLIELRLGDGLGALSPGETGAVVIAGMGGLTICDILSGAGEVVDSQRRLVLQPMSEPEAVRRWAAGRRMAVADEDLVIEAGRFYEVICLDPRIEGSAAAVAAGDLAYEVGPVLLGRRHPLLGRYLEFKIAECDAVIAELRQAGAVREDPKVSRWQARRRALEEVLACL